MYIVFAWGTSYGGTRYIGQGDAPQDAWADLLGDADGVDIGDPQWFRAEPVTVTQKTVFTVEG